MSDAAAEPLDRGRQELLAARALLEGGFPSQALARAWIPHISDEVLHVLIADRGRERLDREEVNRPVAVLEVVDHRLRKARFDGAGREVEPPRVLTRVVLERQREICEIDVLRIQHACPPASAAS